MFNIYKLPKPILDIVNKLSYKIDDVGKSDDIVILFENKYILKISKDQTRLLREKEKMDFLYGKLPVPKSIIYLEEKGVFYHLRSFINGDSLIANRFINNPSLLIEKLSEAISLLRKLDNIEIPFKSMDNTGNKFIHGDLCLPNILVNYNNDISGFIDIDNSGIGDEWYDYAWLLWSLEYNLKTSQYNDVLLKKIGIDYNIEKYESYIPEEYRKE